MFNSILNNAQHNRVELITCDERTFSLDAVLIESHNSKLRVTANPVESGANIADHAVLEPKEVTINGIIVGYEPPTSTLSSLINFDITRLGSYPLPISVKAITAQAESVINTIKTQYSAIAENVQRAIADWLPDNSLIFDSSQTTNRIEAQFELLLSIQKSGKTVTLATASKVYKNMLIVSVSMIQDKPLSASLSIVAQEIFIVDTKKGSGLSVKRTLGRTKPTYQQSSVLSEIL